MSGFPQIDDVHQIVWSRQACEAHRSLSYHGEGFVPPWSSAYSGQQLEDRLLVKYNDPTPNYNNLLYIYIILRYYMCLFLG